MKKSYAHITAAALLLIGGLPITALAGPTSKPATLSFTYQVNATTLPAAQSLVVTLPSTDPASTIINASTCPQTAVTCAASWLSVTPASGYGPLTLSVQVNPTGMAPGALSGSIYIWTSTSENLTVPVTFSITNPPSSLVVSPGAGITNFVAANGTTPDTLSFTYTTGTLWSTLASSSVSSELDVATNGTTIPFIVAVTSGSGKGTSVWLRVNQVGYPASLTTSGVANSGSAVPIIVSLDPTSVESLLPGSYVGTATFTPSGTANATPHAVSVSLVVSAGLPGITSLFPTQVVQAPIVDPEITINGANFFTTSVVTMASTSSVGGSCVQTGTSLQLTANVVSQTMLQATVTGAKTQLASVGNYCVCITNPPSGPGIASVPACASAPGYVFQVISSSQMSVTSVVNAASYASNAKQIGANADPVNPGQTSIAPGEIITVFGQNLGPSTALPAVPGPSAARLTGGVLGGTLNTFGLFVPGPDVQLQFSVTNSADVSTPVVVDFTSDTNALGIGESLQDIVNYINGITVAMPALGVNVAEVSGGGSHITLTAADTGGASHITVIDNAAGVLLGLTSGGGAVTVNGSNTISFPTELAGIQVQLTYYDNGVPGYVTRSAPLIMVSGNQINAMVPFEAVAGLPASQARLATLSVLNNTTSTAFNNLVLVHEDPAVFTLGGTSQGAVLNCPSNANWTINGSKSPSAPAPRGTPICIYATGLGALSTPPVDNVPAATADKTVDTVQVSIGGQPVVVTYAGTSPGSIAGLTQINAIVPLTVPTGSTDVLTVAGGDANTARQSQAGVTVAIK
ncbi:MAG TPA: hypothetical protein VG096_14615 [Bryobacteraceae bacterium]|jgi:uncharacterized protein (TIGR03437 family)|nr:hypothetical protein [Bryobacteraceae bacterium]